MFTNYGNDFVKDYMISIQHEGWTDRIHWRTDGRWSVMSRRCHRGAHEWRWTFVQASCRSTWAAVGNECVCIWWR